MNRVALNGDYLRLQVYALLQGSAHAVAKGSAPGVATTGLAGRLAGRGHMTRASNTRMAFAHPRAIYGHGIQRHKTLIPMVKYWRPGIKTAKRGLMAGGVRPRVGSAQTP